MRLKFDHVMQFKVTLEGIKPPIWRRIQVPCDYSFWDLHVAIQDAMGWMDSHLHEFSVSDPFGGAKFRIGIPESDDLEGEDAVFPGWELPVAGFFSLIARKAAYDYDFGDGWEHTVLLEKIFPLPEGGLYPVCIGGRRACPPEDCGGVPGYQDLVAALADPKHPEHESMLEWVGGAYDPEAFDPGAVAFEDPFVRWKLAFGDEEEPEGE